MGTKVFTDIEDVKNEALCYWNNQEFDTYLPKAKEGQSKTRVDTLVFDKEKDNNTYNIINNVIAFITAGEYYVIPNFYGIQIILENLGFQKDNGLRVLFSTDFEVPEMDYDLWLELMRSMIETNHTFSRQMKHLPEGATPIDDKFLELSYVYSTRYTEHVGKYNYDGKMIVFYYYDGKIYLTANYDIIKELDEHGFVRDESLEIPVLNCKM